MDLGGLMVGIGVGIAITLAALGSWLAWPGRERAPAVSATERSAHPAPPAGDRPVAAPVPPPIVEPMVPADAAPEPSQQRTAVAALPAPDRAPTAVAPSHAAPHPAALPTPGRTSADPAPWRRNAVAVPSAPAGTPRIAIVIDDLGPNSRGSHAVIALPPPLTLAILPYAGEAARMADQARRAGHEVLVHMPMEPVAASVDPGPGALRVALPADALRHRIADGLDRIAGHVGLNNHMGSRFTADPRAMAMLMDEVSRRGLLFLDSRTTVETVAEMQARARGVPFVARDVFLDNDQSADKVEAQLVETERVARRKGFAVAIGHPHAGTRDALAAWLPQARRRGIQLVPISNLARILPIAEARR